ncbi:MAG TPA: IPT/TIG domain-containing protein [Thermoanaerobaculia bacterium]|nr:IPT/TIG domain-containing protein [Thermoanaerobaculia bacterium]
MVILLQLAGLLRAQQTPPFVYAYDEAGRLVGIADATGNTTTYTYDALGNIVSITRGSAAVSILAFSPKSGPVGTNVTIVGAGFSATAAQNAVTFNNVPATVTAATPNRLVAVVPAGATTGPIRVTSPAGTAVSATPFTVGSNGMPSISGFTPTIGTEGDLVTITGANFEPVPGGSKVAFNGHPGIVNSATATTLETAVPATATSGRITVTTPNGRATSTGDFFVPPSPRTAADVEVTGRMAIGETRNVTISQGGKMGLIVFDGAAGQRISLKINLGGGWADSGCDSISIRQPDGRYLVSSTSLCNLSDFIDRQILPVSGTYLIALDPSGSKTGTATLTLYDVPPDSAATIVPGGSPVTVTNTVPGQNAVATFSGVAGQRVSLNVSFGAGLSSCNYVSIRNPDGTALLSQTIECGSSFFTHALVLPATGAYVITVNPTGLSVGSATLTLYNVPPDATATITPGGSPVTVTTTAPGQNAKVSFSGTAGRRVSLLVSFGSGLYPGTPATCNYVSIQNPDGTALLSQTIECGSSFFTHALVLPATGVYVITVNPGGVNVGSATLTLYDVPPDVTATIVAGGPPVTVTTTTPGQNAQVGFGGVPAAAIFNKDGNELFTDGFESGDVSAWEWSASGKRVSLLVSFGSGLYPGSGSCNYVSIQNPDGTPLLSQTVECGSSYFSGVVTLAVPGPHTITMNPGGLHVGTATLTLYAVPEDVSKTITVGGPAAGVTTTVPGQNAAVTFSGVAGQVVTVRMTGHTIGFTTVTLQRPDGSTQASSSSSSTSFNLAQQTLPVTGTYTIYVNPSGSRTGSINVAATSP